MRWLLAVAVLLSVTACGLPDEERNRTVDAASVPYNLLTPPEEERADATGLAVPRGVPVVFWLRRDDRLTPAPVTTTCDDPTADVVVTGAGVSRSSRRNQKTTGTPRGTASPVASSRSCSGGANRL